jgi:universal stress protein E
MNPDAGRPRALDHEPRRASPMSNEIRTILTAVDRDGGQAKRVATKAVTLARLTGASLELFLCDAEKAFSRLHQYEPEASARAKEECLIDSRRYLETLKQELAADDVETTLSVACESPLYESIVRAVKHSRPDLVIRGAVPSAPLNPNDWELVCACPAPLLLTRGQPWKPRPIVAAAVDISPGESEELTRAILRAAATFARAAEGTVEVVHAGRFDPSLPPGFDSRRAALTEKAREAGLEGSACHLIAGEPAAAVRDLCARRSFDLIVLGALTHRKTLSALVGTLTGQLIESLDTDFLLIKPHS